MGIKNYSMAVAGMLSALSAVTAFAQVPTGGTLRIAVHGDPICIDPVQMTTHTTLNIGRNFSATLTDQDPASGKVVPWIAKRWEVNQDATQYIYHLRDDVTYSDGSPVNAASVKKNLENILHVLGPKANRAYNYLTYYAGAEIIDDYTIKINFSKPSGHFLTAASNAWLTLYSDGTLAKTAEERCSGALSSAGPFNLLSYAKLEKTVLERRKDYSWSSPASANPSAPYLDRIEFVVVPENSVRAGLLRTKEVNMISDVGVTDEAPLVGEGFHLLSGINPGVPVSIVFNTQAGRLTDLNIRKAFLHAVNRNELVEALLSSTAKPASGVLVASVPGYLDLSKEIAYDPALANHYLDSAGWSKRNADGIRQKNGAPLKITLTANADRRLHSELLQQQLRAVGIDLAINILPSGTDTVVDVLNPHKFEAVIGSATEADPDILRTYYGPDFRNLPNTKDTTLGDATRRQLALGEVNERNAVIAEIQRRIVDEAYAVPLFPTVQVYAANAAVHGVLFDSLSRLRLDAAWLDK